MSLADDFTTFVRVETLIFRWGKGARSFLVLRTWHGLLQSLYMDVYSTMMLRWNSTHRGKMRRSSSSAKVSNNVSNSGNRNLTPFEIVNIVPPSYPCV